MGTPICRKRSILEKDIYIYIYAGIQGLTLDLWVELAAYLIASHETNQVCSRLDNQKMMVSQNSLSKRVSDVPSL